jgi:hypothetical protein
MNIDILDLITKQLHADIDNLRSNSRTAITRSERSETTGGVVSCLYGALPYAADGAGKGDLMFVENGRKVGEAAGAGTGTLCYYNSATDSWFRVADDTAVVI